MFAIGYAGAAGLFAAAGIKAAHSQAEERKAEQLQEALQNKVTEKAAYVALQCKGVPHFSPWFPTDQEVLVGRYTIEKSKPYIDVGIGVTNDEKANVAVMVTPRVKIKEYTVCLPSELPLNHEGQEVVVHHLDLAEWRGGQEKTTLHRPENAAILLREVGAEADLTAKYRLKAEWFEGDQITLFAQSIRIENRIYLQQPLNGSPYMATTESPQVCIASLKSLSIRLNQEAQQEALIATLFTSASRAYQLKKELPLNFKAHQWLYVSQFPQLKKIYGCLAVCTLAGAALQSGV